MEYIEYLELIKNGLLVQKSTSYPWFLQYFISEQTSFYIIFRNHNEISHLIDSGSIIDCISSKKPSLKEKYPHHYAYLQWWYNHQEEDLVPLHPYRPKHRETLEFIGTRPNYYTDKDGNKVLYYDLIFEKFRDLDTGKIWWTVYLLDDSIYGLIFWGQCAAVSSAPISGFLSGIYYVWMNS